MALHSQHHGVKSQRREPTVEPSVSPLSSPRIALREIQGYPKSHYVVAKAEPKHAGYEHEGP